MRRHWGVTDAGVRLGERVQGEIDSALATIAEVAPSDPEQKVGMAFLYVRGTAGVFFILGDGTGADELITALGGRDLASEGGASGTIPANAEALVRTNPDLIPTMTGGVESTGGTEGFFARPGVAQTRAGANQRVVDMADGQILSFGPNSAAVLLSFATAIYTQQQPMNTAPASHRRPLAVFLLLPLLLLATLLLSASLGQFEIPLPQVVRGILRPVGLAEPDPAAQLADATLWNIRFPRILLGLLVGAALGVSGAVMQAVFGNPLAEPGVIGVSAGAAVGACVALVFGLQVFGIFTVPAFAFLCALATTALVYLLSRTGGRAEVLSMILTGIAVTAVANALIALLVFMADDASRDQIIFWQMGSLNGATWAAVGTTAPHHRPRVSWQSRSGTPAQPTCFR